MICSAFIGKVVSNRPAKISGNFLVVDMPGLARILPGLKRDIGVRWKKSEMWESGAGAGWNRPSWGGAAARVVNGHPGGGKAAGA